MNVASMLKRFGLEGDGIVTVLRSVGGSIRGGKFEVDAIEEMQINGSVQPIRENDSQMDFTNQRRADWRKIYSDERLLVADESEGQAADVVLVDGREYEVKDSSDYRHLGIRHFKSLACLRNKK